MVGLWVRMFVGASAPSAADASTTTLIAQSEEESATEPTGKTERVILRYSGDRKLRRDPFRMNPSTYPLRRPRDNGDAGNALTGMDEDALRRKADKLTLQSILWEEDGRAVACIGDRIVRTGDMIEGFRVVRVHRTRVVLEQEGLRVILTLR